jgi:hypothetical protein
MFATPAAPCLIIAVLQTFTWSQAAVVGLLQALVPALLMNISIVGEY